MARKVDFSQIMLDLDNQPVVDDKGLSVTLRQVVRIALLNNDAQMDAARKLACFDLAIKTGGATEVDITSEEAVLIKERVAAGYGPLIVGRVRDALERD